MKYSPGENGQGIYFFVQGWGSISVSDEIYAPLIFRQGVVGHAIDRCINFNLCYQSGVVDLLGAGKRVWPLYGVMTS
jgi:hypothetical protein